jgi:hypothetical protein
LPVPALAAALGDRTRRKPAPGAAPANAPFDIRSIASTQHTVLGVSDMQINANVDAAGAPTGFAAAVQAAVAFFDKTFTNNVTLNINFDWGGAVIANSVAETSAPKDQYS